MLTVVPSINGNRSLCTPSLETSPPTLSLLADTLSNYDDYRNTLIQTNRFNVPLKIDDAIKHFSDIEDDRYKFF